MAIGVFVISPALPKLSFERELQRNYWQEEQNQGMEFAYIYPGMNKVIQSVGRLIRNAGDKGVAILIGERFASDHFSAIFPEYWNKSCNEVVITKDYLREVREFWQSHQ